MTDSQEATRPDDTLREALARHHMELPDEQIAQLDRYCALLWEWNEKMNLTRHTTYEKFVGRDLVDTLQLAALLSDGEQVLDVGTGGGVPGIPLAILRPGLQLSMCESVGKKARAVADMIERLGLPARIYAERVQEVLARQRFDVLVVRAVARLDKLLVWMRPHWNSCGRLLTIKGPGWVEERGAARHRGLLADLDLRRVATYPLAGTESESVILQIGRRGGQ